MSVGRGPILIWGLPDPTRPGGHDSRSQNIRPLAPVLLVMPCGKLSLNVLKTDAPRAIIQIQASVSEALSAYKEKKEVTQTKKRCGNKSFIF